MKESNPSAPSHSRQTAITALLRKAAHDRAALMKRNTQTTLVLYGLFATVLLLRLVRANIVLVSLLAGLGLGVLWILLRVRWQRLEERLLKEEMERHAEILSTKRETPPAVFEPDPPADRPLSVREIEVLTGVADGRSNKEIAAQLCISDQTVKNHLAHIMTKLEVHDRTSAALCAVSHGWISQSHSIPGRRIDAAAGSRDIAASEN